VILLPAVAFGGMEKCRIIDYPDHVEAVCTDVPFSTQARQEPGETPVAGQPEGASPADSPPAAAVISRRFKKLLQTREQGTQKKE